MDQIMTFGPLRIDPKKDETLSVRYECREDRNLSCIKQRIHLSLAAGPSGIVTPEQT